MYFINDPVIADPDSPGIPATQFLLPEGLGFFARDWIALIILFWYCCGILDRSFCAVFSMKVV
jgi:hypothetical protein